MWTTGDVWGSRTPGPPACPDSCTTHGVPLHAPAHTPSPRAWDEFTQSAAAHAAETPQKSPGVTHGECGGIRERENVPGDQS
jgi:hypothetical protein